ncbi:protocatechuate 3,4-dioxygenase [Novosphingobium flavum]|uniref:Protocatechuate 3,4-dioxygenase n=1 Tax=Novosphingobium aerophilum TaxID=2839843 RepID=A0A7X1KBJ2_9SPHN|nr:class III extradiol dioxygenase family protein [Novosphingobium aerophilum]MBC2651215.1 protocatechuate 3,4-dioxygenase [Novosphingobium aerophilum]MBC2660772.1 protocatechuate 3,4-dioxygenase [Novosphingobium aerophilum]
MAEIVGAYFTSHVPGIGGAIQRGDQQTPYWKPFFDGFPPVREWLAAVRPDIAVVFSNDHGLNFFLDTMPTFAVGAAAEYRNADEGWGLPLYKPVKGHPALSWHVIEQLVADEFDPVTCQAMLVDHAIAIPLELAWPDVTEWPVKLVPIGINTVQHPLPSARRCLALGRSVHRALSSWGGDERIVVIGTGGLSHQLDGERAGFMNPDFDRFCLDHLAADPDALTHLSVHDIVRLAGTQGVEVLNWIAARGALGPGAVEIHRNYHLPISNTAAATMLLEPA